MSTYQKFLRDNDIESGAMLGSFNEDDKYVVPTNVLGELVKIKKLITKFTLEYIDCYAQISDYKIIFRIKYVDDNIDNKRYASLYLFEQYENLSKKYTLTTLVASFSHDNDATFFDALKQAFNLYTIEDLGEGKSIKDENDILENILNEHKSISQILIIEMANDNRKYINNVLKVLKNSSSFETFYKIFRERISQIKAEKNTAKYFYEVKKILDTLVMGHYSEFSEYTREYLDEINKEYMKKYEETKQNSKSKSNQTAPEVKKKKKSKKKENKKGGKLFSATLFDFGFKNFNFDFDFLTKTNNKSYNDEKDSNATKKVINQSNARPSFGKKFIDSLSDTFDKKSEEIDFHKIGKTYSTTNSVIVEGVVMNKEEKAIDNVEYNQEMENHKEQNPKQDEAEFTL